MNWKLPLTIIICCFIASCGFQLRGSNDDQRMVSEPITVSASRASELAILLRSNLAMMGSLSTVSEGAARIDVRNYENHRSIAAVDQTGEVSVYRVTVQAMVTIYDRTGKVVSPTTKISRSGNYDYDSRILNAMTQEEESLVKTLDANLSNAIVRKANVLLAHSSS